MLSEITQLPAPKFKVPYWVAYSAGKISTSLAQWTGIAPAVPLDGVKMAKEMMFYQNLHPVYIPMPIPDYIPCGYYKSWYVICLDPKYYLLLMLQRHHHCFLIDSFWALALTSWSEKIE